jgi:hypothetical protein
MSALSQDRSTTSYVPSDDEYASAVIMAIGAQAAFDASPTDSNYQVKREADTRLRFIRDQRQRAAAQKAGW